MIQIMIDHIKDLEEVEEAEEEEVDIQEMKKVVKEVNTNIKIMTNLREETETINMKEMIETEMIEE